MSFRTLTAAATMREAAYAARPEKTAAARFLIYERSDVIASLTALRDRGRFAA
jgi:hypothetical protein